MGVVEEDPKYLALNEARAAVKEEDALEAVVAEPLADVAELAALVAEVEALVA